MDTLLGIVGVEVGTPIETIFVVDLGEVMEILLAMVGVERTLTMSRIILSHIPNRYKMNCTLDLLD